MRRKAPEKEAERTDELDGYFQVFAMWRSSSNLPVIRECGLNHFLVLRKVFIHVPSSKESFLFFVDACLALS